MADDLAGLLAALVGLDPSQFLLLFLGVAASVLSGFPGLTRYPRASSHFRIIATIIWSISWSFVPNALVDWYCSRDARHIIKRSTTLISLVTNFKSTPPPPP